MDAKTSWEIIAVVLGAFGLIYTTIEKIVSVVKIAKKPNDEQNERLDALEKRVENVEQRLDIGNSKFENIADSNRVSHKALLALLAHGIDGNNIEQLKEAKEELQNHLINK